MGISLQQQIISEENIYKAIYSLESYISEPELLDAKDLNKFHKLRDKYNFNGIIFQVINDCKTKLIKLLEDNNELLEVKVYFKIKKLCEGDNPVVEYRPLHTASLENQICMAAMLMPLMFDDTNGKRNLSELSRMLPHNFYGNIPSCNVSNIFMNWTEKYRQYSKIVTNKCREYSQTKEYDKEISFDLIDFFPSINPLKILNFIWNTISGKYNTNEDKKCLRTIITKLLYFKIPEDNITKWKDIYYKGQKDDIYPINGYYPVRGIAQGLPQSYFFGNLCMIEIAETIKKNDRLKNSDSYFYVDDSVIFAKNIDLNTFGDLIKNLNYEVNRDSDKWIEIPSISQEHLSQAEKIDYEIKFHETGKSTICNIEDSFQGLEGLFLVQRPVSMGGWIKGNIDEVDDNVALKKLIALLKVIDSEIQKIISNKKIYEEETYGEERLKWLRRFRRYFLFRQTKLQILLNGMYDEKLKNDFIKKFYIDDISSGIISKETINKVFELFEEEIFKSEFELIFKDIPQEQREAFGKKLQDFDISLSSFNNDLERNNNFLYYYKISTALINEDIINSNIEYESLSNIVNYFKPFRNSERFVEALKQSSYNSENIWNHISFLDNITDNSQSKDSVKSSKIFPIWCNFIFNNSNNFKRKILNSCFSYACNILIGDNLSILRFNIKPIKYFELRIISMLRNYRLDILKFCEFVRTVDPSDIIERMEIDLGILEGLGIFRQKVQDPEKIDKLIQTHRLVKSLWHNGSKFLNAYTLHNQEHAITLIKNVVRLINNIDFLNLKTYDFFLLFNACYLHDISMVIHPNIASFNDSNTKSEQLKNKWLKELIDINKKIEDAYVYESFAKDKFYNIRKEIGLFLIEIFKDIFDFFEDKVRLPHAYESSNLIRKWQTNMLSFLSELEAETIATISESHGWDSLDIYELKSAAKEELISLKYMMVLIRLADLLDLANDRIDYYLLKQNRSQMNLVSRYHWISHLITEGYELDVDYKTYEEKELTERPIHELIHIDIFLNVEILAKMEVEKRSCKGIKAQLMKYCKTKLPVNDTEYECIEYKVGIGENICSSSLCQVNNNMRNCPFLCLWMSDKHSWLFNELGQLKHYLNSVNSKLIESDITVRFFYTNNHTLDSELYDDVRGYLKSNN